MKRSHEIDMTSGPLLSKILLFAIPLMFTNILQLLFNAADTIVVGKFAGSIPLAAVGSTGSLVGLLVNTFVGISTGVNVLAARYYGSKDSDGLSRCVHSAVVFSALLGVGVAIFGFLLSGPVLRMMKPDPEKSQHWNLCKFLAAGVFKKPSPIIPDGAIPAGSEAGIVWARLRQLIDARSINTAENLLFDSFDKEKPIYAAIALDFYARLSDLSEDDLHECSFSTEEIGEGIRDMMKFYDIKIAMQKPGAKPGEQPAAPEAKESNE